VADPGLPVAERAQP